MIRHASPKPMTPPAAPPGAIYLKGTGAFDYELASVSRFQEALKRATWLQRAEIGVGILYEATLIAEPENGNDIHAVRVEIGEETVGYIRHTHSARYQAAMLKLGMSGGTALASARVSRSSRRGAQFEGFHVKLDLAWPPRI